jgi:hypothetical protein
MQDTAYPKTNDALRWIRKKPTFPVEKRAFFDLSVIKNQNRFT